MLLYTLACKRPSANEQLHCPCIRFAAGLLHAGAPDIAVTVVATHAGLQAIPS